MCTTATLCRNTIIWGWGRWTQGSALILTSVQKEFTDLECLVLSKGLFGTHVENKVYFIKTVKITQVTRSIAKPNRHLVTVSGEGKSVA